MNTGVLVSSEILRPPLSVCIMTSNPGFGPSIGLAISSVGKFVSWGSNERLSITLEDIFVILSSAKQSLLRKHIPRIKTINMIFIVHLHFKTEQLNK